MIQANVAAAETLVEEAPGADLRILDAPSLAKQESLRDFLATLELSLVRGGAIRANHFNGILAKASGKAYETMVNEMVLRAQSKAIYSPENIGHFRPEPAALRPFTSPIAAMRTDRPPRAGGLARPRRRRADAGGGSQARRHRRRDLHFRTPRHVARGRRWTG